MATNQIFVQAKDHFYRNQFQEGLEKINECLKYNPTSSTLLLNRALFYSQLGYLDKAIEQIQNCIKLDYQNYIPYFNLFSLKMRKDQLKDALKQLCCSLSCLYLVRARLRRNQQDSKQSIRYASNNLQAHFFQAMILLESNKLKQCINELNLAYQIDFSVPILNQIREILLKKMGLNQTVAKQKQLKINKRCSQRLICSYELFEQDLTTQIKIKMCEFNNLYNELNMSNVLAAVHGVSLKMIPQQKKKQQINNNSTELKGQNYELMFNGQKISSSITSQIDSNSKVKQNNILQDDSLLENVDPNDRQEISKLNSKCQQDMSSFQDNLSINHSSNQYLNIDEYPQLPNHDEYKVIKIDASQSQLSSSKYLTQNNFSQVSTKRTQQIIELYPMNDRLYGRFRIDKLIVDNQSYLKAFSLPQEQLFSNLLSSKELYCISTYFKEKPGYKVTTCDREIKFNSESNYLDCEWCETFKEVQLTKQPERLFIKIYSKNNYSYNDDLIGIGNILIQKTGLLEVQILSPKDNVYKLGNLYLNLYLIGK